MALTKTQKVAEEAHKAAQEAIDKAKTSKIPTRLGKTKTVWIKKGTDHEYPVTFMFPGVEKASNIIENSGNVFGNTNRTEFMKEVIAHVIVKPKINTLEYWEDHPGFLEVANEAYRFLNDMLN